jgi:hypothetical protein
MPDEKVTLQTVARGAAEELFQMAMQQVLANIHNQNAPYDAKRKITVEIVLLPTDEDRTTIGTTCAVKVSLANSRGVATLMFTNDTKKDGKYVIREHNPNQMHIDEAIKRNETAEKPSPAPPSAQ